MKTLNAALNEITGTGRFCSSGALPFFLPGIFVGGEELGFPLSAAQIKELISAAEAAPYGRGEATVLDESVRRSWQIDPDAICIDGKAWQQMLDKVLKKVGSDLGIEGKVEAVLHKLLIYGKGGHFKPHRDTEKLDAMFGTLIIKLPAKHKGGRLNIRHGGQTVSVDFSDPEHLRDFQYAALFADCEHEVESVNSGHRICLVYNLVLQKGAPALLNRTIASHAAKLRPHFAELPRQIAQWPGVFMLEHQYTEANFSLGNLKNHDQARARALCVAAKAEGFDAHVALVTLYQQGELEGVDFDYGYRGRRHGWDEEEPDLDDGEMGEVYEESLSISHWEDGSGDPAAFGEFRIDPSCLLGDAQIDAVAPIEKEAEGPTGNAGCTMEYWYRRAAVVLWPRSERENVLAQYDIAGAIKEFHDLAISPVSAERDKMVRRLGGAIIARFENNPPSYPHQETQDETRFLEGVALARCQPLFDLFVKSLPADQWRSCGIAEWSLLLRSFPEDAFAPLLLKLEKAVADGNDISASVFAALQACLETEKDNLLASPFLSLAMATPFPMPRMRWREPPLSHAPQIHSLISASHLARDASQEKIRQKILGDESLEHIRIHLAPGLLLQTKANRHFTDPNSLYSEVLEWTKQKLEQEIATPIHPFPDWARPSTSKIAERCPQIDAFLRNPKEREFIYPAIKHEREMIAGLIRSENVDLTCKMLRQGSPHKLVCTKNENSLKERRKQRSSDKTLFEKLSACQ